MSVDRRVLGFVLASSKVAPKLALSFSGVLTQTCAARLFAQGFDRKMGRIDQFHLQELARRFVNNNNVLLTSRSPELNLVVGSRRVVWFSTDAFLRAL